jgi:hypothetical protein
MGVFDGMTLDLTGAGTVDLLTDLRTVFADSDYELYDRTHINGDVALQMGATVNLQTGDYQFAVMANYGHRGSTTDAPFRAAISVTLTWNSGANSTAPLVVDTAAGNVWSGQAIPPLIFTWNSNSETLTATFLGHEVAFNETDLWSVAPNATGAGPPRYVVRYDPARELDNSFGKYMPGACYGGSWLNTDGTRVRADIEQFHTDDGTLWWKAGGGWWLSKLMPPRGSITGASGKPAGVNWEFKADRAHADNGYLAFCQAFVKGGVTYWTNQAWHMLIKQMSARYLADFADPNDGWANIYYNSYYDDSMRSQGRLVSSGTWFWRALTLLKTWRPNDTETEDLANVVGTRVLNIFNQLWTYSKPDFGNPWTIPTTGWFSRYKLPPEEKSRSGFWVRGAGGFERHPDAGGSLPAYSTINHRPYFEGGLMFLGWLHLWEALRDFGLTYLPDFTRVRIMLDFICLGYGNAESIYDHMEQWGDPITQTPGHPFPPPSPLPPTWAQNQICSFVGQRDKFVNGIGCWDVPLTHLLGGYAWAWPYRSFQDNPNNADLKYLEGPSSATTSQQIGLFEFMKREGLKNETKLSQIIVTYQGVSYHYHLGAEPTTFFREENAMSENMTSVPDSSGSPRVDLVDETNAMAEDLVSDLQVAPAPVVSLDAVINESNNIVEVLTPSEQFVHILTLQNDMKERMEAHGIAAALLGIIDETCQIGDEAENDLFGKLTRLFVNVNETIVCTATSVNAEKAGESSSKNTGLSGG